MDGSSIDRSGWRENAKARTAVWRGIVETPILPSFILFATFLGFGALARQTGFSLFDALFAAVFIFALPAMVVLVDQMGHGASLIATALAVSATGIRLLPLVVATVPLIRDQHVPKWVEFLIAHFTAVTMWVETLRRAPNVPKHLRAPYAIGIVVNLVSSASSGALSGYLIAAGTPVIVSAALLFLAPIYFMLAMLASARGTASMLPILLGVVLGPLFHVIAPEFDLILTGLIGGTISFITGGLISRMRYETARTAAMKPVLAPPANTALVAEGTVFMDIAPASREPLPAPLNGTASPAIKGIRPVPQEAEAWCRFMRAPVVYADVGRLAACVNGSLGIAVGYSLRSSGKIKDRLSAIIFEQYDLPSWIDPEQCDERDRVIALASPEQLCSIIKSAGVIYWSSVMASAIYAHELQSLRRKIGEDECPPVLANCETLPPEDALDKRIGEDGLRCFAAWCEAMPHGIGARVRLKLPASPLLDDTSNLSANGQGVAIVRRAASLIIDQ
ncbi:MAG: AzlC family ABC transporter permease [Alphaproteobacteria bacterium]